MVACSTAVWLFIVVILTAAAASNVLAIPALSRQLGTSCMTCHINFPKFNDLSKAFKDAVPVGVPGTVSSA